MIKKVVLKSFRNYENQEVFINDRINMLIGQNGQGKTNFLEAIYYMSFLRSFRKSLDRELIPHQNDFFYFKGVFENEVINSFEIGYDKKNKNVKIDSKKIDSVLNAVGKINVVLFSDKDIELLDSGPAVRRSFLDTTLSVCDPDYLYSLYHYKKVLKMRNASIKNYYENNGDKNSIRAWDTQLVKYGNVLIQKRAEFINEIHVICKELFPVFTDGKLFMSLKYSSSVDFSHDVVSGYYKTLDNAFYKDLKKGVTTRGPHRDDIFIKDKNNLLKKYASKGQARAATLILRLAQMKYIEKQKNQKCILLLDDILLDLDSDNKKNFLDILGDQRQCFFTATSKKEFHGINGTFYLVNNGNINIYK